MSRKEIQIKKATPKQFFKGVEGWLEILEKEIEDLKKIIKEKENYIDQLKLLLNHKDKYINIEVNNNE